MLQQKHETVEADLRKRFEKIQEISKAKAEAWRDQAIEVGNFNSIHSRRS